MKVYGTHACGHEGMIDVSGSKSQREWQEKRFFEDDCTECKDKQRAEENKKNAALAAEMGLPELRGSPKQIAWAHTIRMKYVEMEDKASEADTLPTRINIDKAKELMHRVMAAMYEETSASFWIDMNFDDTRMMNFLGQVLYYHQKNKSRIEEKEAERVSPEGKDDSESIIRPEVIKHDGVVDIAIKKREDKSRLIEARYVKDDDFRKIVKSHHMLWSSDRGCWFRNVFTMYGSAKDLAADISSDLLRAGFCIRCKNETVRGMIVSGKYTPECRKWISYSPYDDGTIVSFVFDRDDRINDAVRSIGAKWDKTRGEYILSASHYIAIRDFARLYGFKIIDEAERRLTAAQDAVDKAPVVDAGKKPIEQALKNPLSAVLESSTEVLPDLRDDQ